MEICVSHQLDDAAWDAFLDKLPRSHYLQSSLWAQVNNKLGWNCLRMVVKQNNQIVAGFQLYYRPVPVFGNVGYIPRGPAVAYEDSDLTELIIEQLYEVIKTQRIIYLKIQPSYTGVSFAKRLSQEPFSESDSHADNVATLLIDLTQDEEQLLKNMKKSLRKGVRKAERSGVVVRQGTGQDLGTFYDILQSTGQRGEFAIHNRTYYQKVWEKFGPSGRAALLIAEFETEPVAAVFLILFGDTVFARYGGWNGQYGKYEPNSFLRWTAIQWAKGQGYRWYDFMGIDESVARSILQSQSSSNFKEIGGYTGFKLGFGGKVELSPTTFDYVSQPLLSKSLRWFQSKPGLYNRILNLIRSVR